MDIQYERIKSSVRTEQYTEELVSSLFSYSLMATLTAPLVTLGVSLQLSSIKLEKFYGDPGKEISRLELAKSHEVKVQERLFNEVQISSGTVGNNRPFRAPYYKNYREVFSALTAQGYKGFFKGNFIDLTRYVFLAYPLYNAKYVLSVNDYPKYLQFYALFLIETVVEYVYQPFRVLHSRFILQNRIPEYSQYRSILRCVQTLRHRGLNQGNNVVIPKKFLAYSCFCFTDSTVDGFLLYFISLFISYPLDTLQRRLEVQSGEHSMLPRRYLKDIRWSMSRIYHEEGIFKGFYRGFICNSLASMIKHAYYPAFASQFLLLYKTYNYTKENIRD